MPVTAQGIFERAIGLMDEGDEHTGRTDIPETQAYKHRTLAILNLLGQECAAILDRPEGWADLAEFGTAVSLPEGLARTALPYGLAAHLFLEENPAAASFFQQRYEAILARWAKAGRAEGEGIPLPYGDLAARDGGGWPRCP